MRMSTSKMAFENNLNKRIHQGQTDIYTIQSYVIVRKTSRIFIRKNPPIF